MKLRKTFATILTCVLTLTLLGGAMAETADIGEAFAQNVSITMMNSKPEITEALEAAADTFGAQYNVTIEITETDSPADTIAQRYAAGDAPTIMVLDTANIRDLADGKIVELTGEAWAAVGGEAMGRYVDGKLYGMPLTIESQSVIYNKTAIEAAIGHAFDPADYTTLDAFSALLDELKAGGMAYPVVLNSEDWSIGHKMYQFIYDYVDGTAAGAIAFLKDINAGNTTFASSTIFNSVLDTFDVMIANNINHTDPLAADYDLNASYVAEGEAAFWVNGTWAWPDFAPFAQESTEYGIMPYPLNDSEATAGKVIADSTKYIAIDAQNASEEQQQAAKMFLNWLVFSPEGQDALINQCGIITPYTNISLEPNNPFNASLKSYIDAGMTVNGATYMPSDHRSMLAATMQAYLVGEVTRDELAQKLNDYWTTNLPKE